MKVPTWANIEKFEITIGSFALNFLGFDSQVEVEYWSFIKLKTGEITVYMYDQKLNKWIIHPSSYKKDQLISLRDKWLRVYLKFEIL